MSITEKAADFARTDLILTGGKRLGLKCKMARDRKAKLKKERRKFKRKTK